jgi:hypothetical protein
MLEAHTYINAFEYLKPASNKENKDPKKPY